MGSGGGIREWNAKFILLGAQLFILISPVSCCIFLILGLNPGSTSFSVAELGKADTGYSPAPCSHRLSSHCSRLLRGQAPQRNACLALQTHSVPIHGDEVFKVSHLMSRPTPNGHDNLSWSPQSCLHISVLLVPQDLKGPAHSAELLGNLRQRQLSPPRPHQALF